VTRPPLRRLTAACVAVAFGLTAGAGVPTRDILGIQAKWTLDVEQPNVKGGKITYFVDPRGSVEEPPGADTELDAIHAAIASWEEAPGSRIRFSEDPVHYALGPNAEDRVNYIGWKIKVLSPFTLSTTYTLVTDGVITDADVIFNDNADFFRWATVTPGIGGYVDVQSVATHELGHVFGLDHSPVTTATMCALLSVGAISSRSLAPDDDGALIEAYPTLSDPAVGSILGTVRIGRRPAPRGLPVFALDARTGDVQSCCFTADRGTYAIRGLPPGPYRVVAAPLASVDPYSKWWARAPMKVLPGFLVDQGPGGALPRTVVVRGGFPETRVDFSVPRYARRAAGEPDDGPDDAREIPLGGAATGVFEVPGDEDWFRVRTDGTDRIDVRVRSWGLGAAADPELAIFAADGETLLLSKFDLRPSVDEEAFHGPLGPDKDPVITGFTPPGTGDLFLRVRAQPQSDSGRPGCFYVVDVVPSTGVPDDRLSSAVLAPAAVRAGSGVAPLLTAVPRDWRGDPIGPGATVTALRSDGGAPLLLDDLGDGTYTGTVPAPVVAGEIRFSLQVAAPAGSALRLDAARLTVAGPVDGARSSLDAAPARVEAGSTAPVTVIYTPRDGAGRLLGAGLDVAILFEGSAAGLLGPVADLGDGSYRAMLAPAADPSSARVTATVDGGPSGISRLVGFGWDLTLVAADLGAVVVEAKGQPGVSKSENRIFGDAGESLDGVLVALAAKDEIAAATAASSAVAALARAVGSPRFNGGPLAPRDVAEALRRRIHSLVDVIVFAVPDPAGQRRLGLSKSILARGDAQLLAGDAVRAARSYLAALRKAAPLL